MDFYERKRRAFMMVDKLFEANCSVEEIVFQVQTAYGMDGSLVGNRIRLLRSRQETVEKFHEKKH